jgi:hypothetical protein
MTTPLASLEFLHWQLISNGLRGPALLTLARQVDHMTCGDVGIVGKFIADLAVLPYSVCHVMVSIIVLINYIDSLGYSEFNDPIDDMLPRMLSHGYIVQTIDFVQASAMIDVVSNCDKDYGYVLTLYKLIHELAVESLKIE